MKTNILDSFTPSFDEKSEILKIDSFKLMQFYISGRISFEEFKNSLKQLSQFKLLTEKELFEYIKPKATYEAYQYAIGKSKEERKVLSNRLFKLTEEHKKS